MKKILSVFTLLSVALAACNFGYEESEGGMLYKIHEDKDSKNIQTGDFLSVNVIVKTDGDSVLYNSYETGQPSMMLAKEPAYKGDLFSAFLLLSEGDSATVKIPVDTIFSKTGEPKPPAFKNTKFFIYQLKVSKVIAKDKLSNEVFESKISEFFKSEGEKAQKGEVETMKRYISSNGLKPTVTASGLNYVITKPGSGLVASKGDTIEVNYTGKLTTGKVFDTSIKSVAEESKVYTPERMYEPLKFPVGEGRVIAGWEEALQLLGKGSKATLIIPSKLGYGEQGAGASIPPYSTLIFDIEIVNVIKGKGTPLAAKTASGGKTLKAKK